MNSRPDSFEKQRDNVQIVEIEKPIDINKYRQMYTEVGGKLNWLDRIFMPDEDLKSKINSEQTHIYMFNINKQFAGYCELIREKDYTEILYFGLTESFIGKGFGKYLLNKTIELSWSFGPNWIQLNTCDLDHPNALATYKKAGFEVYNTITEEKKVTDNHH